MTPDTLVNEPCTLRVALAQINPRVGDLRANTVKIKEYTAEALQQDADIILFPELAVTGYPPEDLLLKPGFLTTSRKYLDEIVNETGDIVSVVGFVDRQGDIYNAAAVIHNGQIVGVHRKEHLPNYGVFDEERYFQRGISNPVFDLDGIRFGVNICEDIWYPDGPAAMQTLVGEADLIVVVNASPYHRGKWRERERMLATRASDNTAVLCYVNCVGGQDELVFDGMSLVAGPDARIRARAKAFEEQLLVCDIDVGEIPHLRARDARRRKEKLLMKERGISIQCVSIPGKLKSRLWSNQAFESRDTFTEPLDDLAEVYSALVTGTRDYIRKNGFSKAVVGLSGGIDSALTFAIACDALGEENVLGVTMPGMFSSEDTKSDAQQIAENFNTEFLSLPIEDIYSSFMDQLQKPFDNADPGLAEENLQARIRGTLLMAISNKLGHLVLTTGNKSEMACGYATLYGDMAGGFAVLKDVPKTLVWKLSEWRNRDGEMIPESTIKRLPSAELREDQKDTDSLPEYEVLDEILFHYVEQDRSLKEIVAKGFDEATVRKVISMVDASEYKRRQAPPGVKITPKAFGRDRRLPVTNGYCED